MEIMNEKEILERMIKNIEEQLISNKITERYFARKLILTPSKNVEMNLGKLQAEIKENEEYLKFLCEQLKKILEEEDN